MTFTDLWCFCLTSTITQNSDQPVLILLDFEGEKKIYNAIFGPEIKLIVVENTSEIKEWKLDKLDNLLNFWTCLQALKWVFQ